ncbi:MAG: hypothetical protein M3167_20200 [Acidobacteriota bacterium]|nr:hypothetical protein [Acidobacteriota bacterium]
MKKTRTTAAPRRPRKTRTASSPGARAARIVWIGLAVVAGLAILLAVAGSIALHWILASGKVKQWVNTEPEKLRIEYTAASGWNPWAVHVQGLELRNRDPNVEFWFRIEDARFSFSPLQILSHRFHVGRLTGRGLTYRLRIRSDPKTTQAPHFAAQPPIPGFGPRPLPPAEPIPGEARTAPQAQGGAASDHPFAIEIDDLRIDSVREVWIELYRHHGGTGTLAGSFSLTPHRRAQVGPARLALSGGELALGRHTLLRPASFETNTTIQAFDPRLVKGDAVWPFISGNLRLEGPLAGLGFLNYFLDGEPRLEGGAGTGRASVDIEKGRGKGNISLGSRGLTAAYRKANLRGNLTARIRLDDWDFEHDAIDFSGSRIELTDIDAREPGPDSTSWSGRFDLKTAKLRSGVTPPLDTQLFVHCRDARPLFTLFNVGLPGWVRGLLKLEGFDAHARVGLGPKYTRIQGLEGTGGSFRIRGRYLERRDDEDGAFLIESGALSVGVGIEHGMPSLKLIGAQKWFEAEAGKEGSGAGSR